MQTNQNSLQKKSWIKKKWFFLFLLTIAALFACIRVYYKLTDDFRLANITSDTPHRTEWEIPALGEKDKSTINAILSQRFTYIGKGAQSYAFGSEDGRYVIKFFKFKHLRPSLFLKLLPISLFKNYQAKQMERKERKFKNVFSGYHLAYEVHREDSGILFVHLNKTDGLFATVTLEDKIGRRHLIHLDDVPFVLQYKAKTLKQVAHEFLSKNQLEETKTRISQIFHLYLNEYQKGIFDDDHGVIDNTGFIADRPIRLDVGQLKRMETIKNTENYSEDIILTARKMAESFQKNEPDHYHELAKHIETEISSILGKPFRL